MGYKVVFVFAGVLLLTGCNYFTARVNTIGLRNYEIQTSKKEIMNGKIDGNEFEVIARNWGESIWSDKKNGELIGIKKLKIIQSTIKNNEVIGIIIEDNDGRLMESHDFNNGFFKGQFVGSAEYRKWYGYPAQILKIVTIPLDIIFFWLL